MAHRKRDTMVDPKGVTGTPEWIEHVFTGFPMPVLEKERIVLSVAFQEAATTVVRTCPPSADRTVALRKLREAMHSALDAIALGGVG